MTTTPLDEDGISDSMLVPHITDRGFKHMPVIITRYDDRVRVYESSSAITASIWLSVNDATAHLSLEQASTLILQMAWLIEHHYHIPPSKETSS